MDHEPVLKLTKDLKTAAVTLSKQEVRFLVDAYYTHQSNRIRAANQIRAMSTLEDREPEPHEVLDWLFANEKTLEGQILRALDAYTASTHMGQWSREICGIGPVIAAGLEAHIDITRAPTAGHIWRFAGLDPTTTWLKGKKRPHNADLKTLCWKLGESFVKVSGNEKDVYGKLYLQRKAIETQKNDRNEFSEQAEISMHHIGKNTETYKYNKEGKLSPGHIHSRAKRWAVKIFLSHWHAEAYRNYYKQEPPKPFVIEHMGHAHQI